MATAKMSALLTAALCAFVVVGCSKDSDVPLVTKPESVVVQKQMSPQLPILMGEKTPYFWRREVKDPSGKWVKEVQLTYRDGRYGVVVFGKPDVLENVSFFDSNAPDRRLVYQASYDASGQRILRSKYCRPDGSLETDFERLAEGAEQTRFYSASQKLMRSVVVSQDGAMLITDYAADGVTIASTNEVKSEIKEMVFSHYRDGDKTSPRIKLRMSGMRILDWQYFTKDGKLDHTGSFEADGSIQFVFYKPDGSLYRKQRWNNSGEDWNRAYYRLGSAEVFGEKNKAFPEHKATFHRNGCAKQHFRYDKEGGIEAIRHFDQSQQEFSIEEFEPNGQLKRNFQYPVVRRGFIPVGLFGDPGCEDAKNPAYNFEGELYALPKGDSRLKPLFVPDKK